MSKHIEFRDGGRTFDIQLPSRVTILTGDSGVDKSYFVDALTRAAVLSSERRFFPKTQVELDSVPHNTDALVVVDRADILKLNVSDIENDTNTYIIIARHTTYIRGSKVLSLRVTGNRIYGGV